MKIEKLPIEQNPNPAWINVDAPDEFSKELIQGLVKGIEVVGGNTIDYIWIDLGKEVYSLHIEIRTCEGNEDLYFSLIKGELIGAFWIKGVKLSDVVDNDTYEQIIEIIKVEKVCS